MTHQVSPIKVLSFGIPVQNKQFVSLMWPLHWEIHQFLHNEMASLKRLNQDHCTKSSAIFMLPPQKVKSSCPTSLCGNLNYKSVKTPVAHSSVSFRSPLDFTNYFSPVIQMLLFAVNSFHEWIQWKWPWDHYNFCAHALTIQLSWHVQKDISHKITPRKNIATCDQPYTSNLYKLHWYIILKKTL